MISIYGRDLCGDASNFCFLALKPLSYHEVLHQDVLDPKIERGLLLICSDRYNHIYTSEAPNSRTLSKTRVMAIQLKFREMFLLLRNIRKLSTKRPLCRRYIITPGQL